MTDATSASPAERELDRMIRAARSPWPPTDKQWAEVWQNLESALTELKACRFASAADTHGIVEGLRQTCERARIYADAYRGKNDLNVGPLMMCGLLDEIATAYADTRSAAGEVCS